MPIDIASETLVRVTDVPKYVPGRPHTLTIYRWIQRAKNPLEAIRVGGRLFSSVEAIHRFIERCSSDGAVAPTLSAHRQDRVEKGKMETARS